MRKNKNLLFATLSVALMIGSGFLLSWTINDLYGASPAFATLSLSLLSVFIFIIGSSLMGRSIRKENVRRSQDDIYTGVQIAFLLIASGILLLCFNTGVLNSDWKNFFISWQMLLFVVGALSICKSHFISGLICATVGIFLLIEKAIVLYPNDIQLGLLMSNIWPAIFIVSGIILFICFIIRPRGCRGWHCNGNWGDANVENPNENKNENENEDGKINYRFVFGGTEQVILEPVFKGGTIDVTFGGIKLDLRRTSLAEGKTFLYINAVIGGVEMRAPDTWDIEIQNKSTIGGVTDSRLKHLDRDHTRKLVIISKCTLSGIEIK